MIKTKNLKEKITNGYVQTLLYKSRVVCTKFISSVIILGINSNEGHVMPLQFFLQGFRVNVAAYIEVLDKIIKPLGWQPDSVYNGRLCIFQKDWALSHKAIRTNNGWSTIWKNTLHPAFGLQTLPASIP